MSRSTRTRLQSGSEHAPNKERKYAVYPFRGMFHDLKRRLPYYWSDFRDALDYRIIPSTIYMYFANIMPALAFALDMFTRTGNSYGVNEVLLASVLGAVVFSLFAAQPLTIVGVTGPITVFNLTVYEIVAPKGTPYFQFMCWIQLWSMVMHFGIAILNGCNGVRFVTQFSCDIFGFYVATIYIQKGVETIRNQFAQSDVSAYLSLSVALLVFIAGVTLAFIGNSKLFQRHLRLVLADYGTPLTVIFFSGFVHIGYMARTQLQYLPTSTAFQPTASRGWAVDFWNLDVRDIFLAIPFAVLLTILFYFDHNVSALMAQGTEYPLRKPAGFHWDFFLLGVTTGVAGILGLPAPNGLIPQAPFHTDSLCVRRQVEQQNEHGETITEKLVVDHVVEQRVSNLAQGLLTVGTMTGPLLVVLGLIPDGVLGGLFWVMGFNALSANGITQTILYLCQDKGLTPKDDPLNKCRKKAVYAFLGLQILAYAATFAITQTIAAIGFPIFILVLIPFRAMYMPRWFTPEELAILDSPAASAFTLESVGGSVDVEDKDETTGSSSGSSERETESEMAALEQGDGMRLKRRTSRLPSVDLNRLAKPGSRPPHATRPSMTKH